MSDKAHTDWERQLADFEAQPADGWLDGQRAEAAGRLARGLPNRRVEQWKFTDLRARLRAGYAAAPLVDGPAPASLFDGLDALRIDIVNGAPRLPDVTPPGLRLLSFADALTEERALVEAQFRSAEASRVIFDINAMLAGDGVVILVEKGADLAQPIHLAYGAADADGAAWHVRTLVVVEEGARATLLESYAGEGRCLANAVTNISVGSNAHLIRIVAQSEALQAAHLCADTISLAADAQYDSFALLGGGELSRRETHLTFTGEGARASLKGVSLLDGARHADTTLFVEHEAAHCDSVEQFKTAVRDQGRSVFQGKIVVARGAQKTDAQMGAHALLLSDRAEADAKPELEIYADDVKCAHGATSGDLDEDQLFYLRARGVPEMQARGLLIEAFLSDLIEDVSHEGAREALRARLQAWLAGEGV